MFPIARVQGLVLLVAAVCAQPLSAQTTSPAGGDGANRAASEQAFRRIAEVLRHPRCLNCHTVTDFPRQGDTRHRHQQMVVRGPDGRGAATMRCSNCHQEHNSADGRIPGAHNWHLAPLSMGWEHLKTDGALCRAFVDPAKNGNRDVAALAEHMTSDPLVQWAWTPGARQPPGIGQQEFHAVVRRWAATGGACPRD